MVTIAVGALLGWAFSGALIGWGIVTTAFGAIMLGASLGSLFASREMGDFSSSPTYSFGPISNTMSQLVPIPVIYGKCRVAGNIIYQVFADDKKEVQDLYILVGEGPVTAINSVLCNDQDPAALEDCSVTCYLTTTAATHDGRDPSGARPYPDDVALICLTLKAQEKLNGTPTTTSIVDGVKVWTPAGFVWSRNPVWIILDILCHPRYGLGYGTVTNGVYQHPDWDKIDYACAVAAAAYCDGTVSYGARFMLDFTLDTQRPIRDVLADFLASCRGYMVETDKLQICIDAPVSIYSREITPNNIVEGSFTFWQAADEDVCNRITIDWIDPANSYERVTDVFQDSADIADRGVVEKSISMLPVTRSGQVGHMGYYLLKTSLMVRNFCSFGVGLKDCDIQPGEVLQVTFESFTGWHKKPFRVVSVKNSGQDVMTVTCSEYIADVYDDSVLDITHHIDTSLNTNYKPDDVTDMAITEQLETLQDGSYNLIAKISWTPPASYSSLELWYRYSSEVSWKPAGTLPRGSEEYYLPCTEKIGDTLYVKIYVVSRLGVRSDGQTTSKILRGDLTPPAPPTNLQGVGGFRMASLTWTDPGDGDLDHIEIYRSLESDTAEMTKIGIAPRFAQEYVDSNLSVLQTAWYRLKAVDVAGNKSEYSGVISTTTKALEAEDIPDGAIAESHLAPGLAAEIDKIPGIETDVTGLDVKIDEREAAIRARVDDLAAGVQADLATADAKADGIISDLSALSAQTESGFASMSESLGQTAAEAASRLAAAKETLRAEAKELSDFARDQFGEISEAALGALEMAKHVGDRLSDAGVYIDPASGEVRIYGLDVLREETDLRITNAEIKLDAQAATISTKVTLAQVDERIAGMAFGNVGELLLEGVNARIDEVEETLDAQELTITEKASRVEVESQALRITQAESDIAGLDAAIALKASQLEVAGLTARVNSAELSIDAQNGTISGFVGQYKDDIDELSDAAIQNAIRGWENQQSNKQALAYAKQELTGKIDTVDGKLTAEAAARLELAAQVANAEAALLSEQTLRAAEDEAIANLVDSVITSVEDARAAISEEAETRAAKDETYGKMSTALTAEIGGDAGEAAVEAALAGYENSRRLTRQMAGYYQNLEAKVKENEEASAARSEALAAQMNLNRAALTREQTLRATQDAAIAQDVETLYAETADNAAAITREAQARTSAQETLAAEISSLQTAATTDKAALLEALAEESQARIAAIEAEAEARGSALTTEEEARIEAITAEAEARRQAIEAAVGEETRQRTAAIEEEKRARIGADETYGAMTTAIVARSEEAAGEAAVNDVLSRGEGTKRLSRLMASYFNELDARIRESGEAEAARRETLAVQVGQNAAAVSREAGARSGRDEALAADIASLYAETADNRAAVTSEAQARATQDAALSSRIETVSAQAGAARQEMIDALATESQSRIAAIEAEAEARGRALTAEEEARIAAIEAEAAARQAAIENESQARNAAVETERNARVSADAALAASVELVSAAATDNHAAILEEKETRAAKDETYGKMSTAMIAAADAGAGEAAVDAVLLSHDFSRRLAGQYAAAFNELSARIETGKLSELAARELLAAQLDAARTAILRVDSLRADGDAALAASAETLEAAVGDNVAQIERLSLVTAGKPDIYNQSAAPAGTTDKPLKLGDLWIDGDGLIHRWNGASWADCKDKELADLMEVAAAQTWLKAQTAANGRKVLAGIGVMADSTDGAEICMLADRFYLVSSKDGTLVQPFAIDATDPNNPKVVINGNLFVQALKDGGYADSTGWIIGDKLAANSKIQLAEGGEFIAGADAKFQLGTVGSNAAILIDSETGRLVIKDPNDLATGNFIRVDSGDISTFKYIAGAYREMKSLRKMAFGSNVANGSTVTLDGYWPSSPKIIVSPCQIQTYNSDSTNQSQSLQIHAAAINRDSNGVVTFVPTARLVVAAGIGSVASPVAPVSKNIHLDANFGPVSTPIYSSVPSGATGVTVTAKVYAQRMSAYSSGHVNWGGGYVEGYNLIVPVEAIIGGVTRSLGSVSIPARYGDLSNEPTTLYQTISNTFDNVSGSISLKATPQLNGTARLLSFDYDDGGNILYEYRKSSYIWLQLTAISWNMPASANLAEGTLNYMAIAE